jgi:hypothetical protein
VIQNEEKRRDEADIEDHCTFFLNILIIFNISNIDKEINKELPEDYLIEDRNMLECFLKVLSYFNIT